MALGKRSRSMCGSVSATGTCEVFGNGLVMHTRGFGRKRVAISNDVEAQSIDSSPLKSQCSQRVNLDFEKSALETLPQDILIRIISGVERGELKQLFHVSKAIREATLIAKQWHFACSTPRKSRRCRSEISEESLAGISVALFASPRKKLFM